jgi:transcriptional antiterminator
MVVQRHTTRNGENPMDKEQCMLDAQILQAQGYTQIQIAKMLGVSDRTVRN